MRTLLSLFAITPLLLSGNTTQVRTLDASQLGPLTFAEDCLQPLDLWSADGKPRGRWKTNYFHSDQHGFSSRNLAGNGDRQVYSAPTYNGVDPFGQVHGECLISADVDHAPSDPRNGGAPYTSGILSTEKSFAQRYGYFEMRAALPQAKGMWPAFWLWSANVPEGHEIDVLESVQDGSVYGGYVDWSVPTTTNGQQGRRWLVRVRAVTDRLRDYGLLWTPTRLCYYLDRVERGCTDNPGFNSPMFLMLNLAVGGHWPGNPSPDTSWPQVMRVKFVHVYMLKR